LLATGRRRGRQQAGSYKGNPSNRLILRKSPFRAIAVRVPKRANGALIHNGE